MNAVTFAMERKESDKLLRQSKAARQRLLKQAQRLQRLLAAEDKYRERLEGNTHAT